MTESDSESLLSERPDEENRRLREENARLRQILAIHGISVPPAPPTDSTLTQAAGTASPESKEERARKRIALFRSLFRGREDVYARRWENARGQAGYTKSVPIPISRNDLNDHRTGTSRKTAQNSSSL